MYCRASTRPKLAWIFQILVALTFPVPLACAFDVTLQWDTNADASVAGYKIYLGTQSRDYSTVMDVGNQTSRRVQGLEPGRLYYFAVTAYSADGLESDFSEETTYTIVIDGTKAMLVPLRMNFSNASSAGISFIGTAGQECFVQASSDLRSWQTIYFALPATNGLCEWIDQEAPQYSKRFYRVVGSHMP
jgi:hypothetical protein